VGDVFRWLRKLATGYFLVAPPALKEKSHVLNRTHGSVLEWVRLETAVRLPTPRWG